MKHVAEKTSLLRNNDLSYEHHKSVASLLPEQQKEFLQKAAEELLIPAFCKVGKNNFTILIDLQ